MGTFHSFVGSCSPVKAFRDRILPPLEVGFEPTTLRLTGVCPIVDSRRLSKRRTVRANAEVVAGCVHQVLAYSQVPLRRHDGFVAERKLNLLQGGPPFVSEFGKRTTQVMRS